MKRTAFSPHDEVYIQYLKNIGKHDMPVQHYHDGYEIYLQLSGRRYLFYDNICYTLSDGDMAVFAPFDLHYAESRESDYFERYVLNFREEILTGILSGEERFALTERLTPCVVHLGEESARELYELFIRADKYSKKCGLFADKLKRSAVLQLLVYVTECIGGEESAKGAKIAPQIMAAVKFISKNYAKPLTLDEIANSASMSKYHFCRRFKDITGATALEYLNNVRLTKVHSLLLDTDRSLEDIAKATGFSSTSNLTRVFKGAYGAPPSAFRKSKKS